MIPPSACSAVPSVFESSTRSKASSQAARCRSQTSAGRTPWRSAEFPLTTSRWMWWERACRRVCSIACRTEAVSVFPLQREGRRGTIGAERVARRLARHVEPVDAAETLSPARDPADEALRTRERHPARPPFDLGPPADLLRQEELGVEVRRERAVKEPGLARSHPRPGRCRSEATPRPGNARGRPAPGPGRRRSRTARARRNGPRSGSGRAPAPRR